MYLNSHIKLLLIKDTSLAVLITLCAYRFLSGNLFFSLLVLLYFFNWRIIAFQCCVGFMRQCESAISIHISPPS